MINSCWYVLLYKCLDWQYSNLLTLWVKTTEQAGTLVNITLIQQFVEQQLGQLAFSRLGLPLIPCSPFYSLGARTCAVVLTQNHVGNISNGEQIKSEKGYLNF